MNNEILHLNAYGKPMDDFNFIDIVVTEENNGYFLWICTDGYHNDYPEKVLSDWNGYRSTDLIVKAVDLSRMTKQELIDIMLLCGKRSINSIFPFKSGFEEGETP